MGYIIFMVFFPKWIESFLSTFASLSRVQRQLVVLLYSALCLSQAFSFRHKGLEKMAIFLPSHSSTLLHDCVARRFDKSNTRSVFSIRIFVLPIFVFGYLYSPSSNAQVYRIVSRKGTMNR